MAIKVLGTGLGRTGTMSLKMALEHLEGGKCFHMVELMKEPHRLPYLKKRTKEGKVDWESLFEGFNCCVDYPICLYYKELIEVYPNLKIVHTLRDSESWYDSVKETIYKGKPKNGKDILRMIFNMIRSSDFRKVAPVFRFADEVIWSGQFQSRFEDKAFAISIYERHLEEVKAFVPKENLLLFDVREGWSPLCRFLNKPVPNVPFPKTNQKVEFVRKMDKLLVEGKFEA